MNGKTAALLLSGLLAGCAQTQPPAATAPPAPAPPAASAAAPATTTPAPAAAPAPAQAATTGRVSHVVTIQSATCQGLMRLSEEDRAAAAMFYIGYQASRSRARTIDVSLISSIEAQAFVYCQENPSEPLVRAFARAYSEAAR